mmetsp:Transcript_5729/g.10657  ORF Transcript_5729/g.10657 Transcript_5729/m.10657 type:complete len:113 (-) Transcript_5729:25-363(-)
MNSVDHVGPPVVLTEASNPIVMNKTSSDSNNNVDVLLNKNKVMNLEAIPAHWWTARLFISHFDFVEARRILIYIGMFSASPTSLQLWPHGRKRFFLSQSCLGVNALAFERFV